MGCGCAIGSVISGIFGMAGANQQNSANAGLQQQEEAYNTQMADTTYQRGVADMKAAGINPMLAFQQGGDPSPTAPVFAAQSPLSEAANSAASAGKAVQDMVENGPQLRKETATAQKNTAQTQSEQAATLGHKAHTDKRIADERLLQEQNITKQVAAQTPATQAEAQANTAESHNRIKRAKAEAPLQSAHAYVNMAKDVTQAVNSAASAVKGGKPLYNQTTIENYDSRGEHTGTQSIRRSEQ